MFSDEELKAYAPFVADEMQRFRKAFNRWTDLSDQSIENSWAGMATLVHYRCLLAFFNKKERKGKQDDDVLAVDYLPTWKNEETPEWIKAQQMQCNKMLSHLSYSRLKRAESDDHFWNVNLIRHTEKAWRCFIQQLPSERRTWFEFPPDD